MSDNIVVKTARGDDALIATKKLNDVHINKHLQVDSKGNEATLPLTIFDEVKFAELSPIWQYSYEATVDNTELNTNTLTNGGTITQANAMAVIGTSTTPGSTALMQTKRAARYRAGEGGEYRFTTELTETVAGTEQLQGLADEVGSAEAFKNGYMIGDTIDGIFGFHTFQSDSKISIPLADWDDPLNGEGESGMTLDRSKLNVWFIIYGYLGGSDEVLILKDETTKLYHPVLRIFYANKNNSPSVHNPNFFGTSWVNNGATNSDIVFKIASQSYFTQGKTELIMLHQPQQSTGTVTKSLSAGVEAAIVTIRNKATYASKTNFIEVLVEKVTGSIEANGANNLADLFLTLNATLGGTPSYSDINTTDSVLEVDTAGTTVTGGKLIMPFSLAGKNDKIGEDGNIKTFKIILSPQDTLTLSGNSVGDATVKASILCKELF